MRRKSRLAVSMAAILTASVFSQTNVMAGNAISVDMTDYNDYAWADIAMVNDDTVETGVNIRSSASVDSPSKGFLYRGGAVRVLDKMENWTSIESGGITGYVKNEYLVYGAEAKGLAEHYGTYGARASWNDVNVFSGQSGMSEIVDTANGGDTYKLVGQDGAWMAIQTSGDSLAYVPAEDVDVVMMLGTAVPLDGEAPAGVEDSFREVEYTNDSYTESYDDGYTESYDDGYTESYDDGYTESYDDGYTESYDDGYTESYDDGYTESYDDGYTESYTDSSASYEEPVNTSGSAEELAAQASSLYQDYVDAQNAADAAVANGAGEKAIVDTANAAVAAYGRYLKAQNAADAAAWGVTSESTDTSSYTETASYDSQDEAYEDEYDYEEDDEEEDDYEDTSDTTPQVSASTSDVELLAALIYCEAGNQPYEGQVAVGAVVMNRISSSAFPNTIRDVIYQAGQFTPAYSGALAAALNNGSGAGYVSAANDALSGSDPTEGALYFNVHQGTGKKIGAHWFF